MTTSIESASRHDLAERKGYWKDTEKENVTYWVNWTADSLSDAQDIERHFINKGMKGGTGGESASQENRIRVRLLGRCFRNAPRAPLTGSSSQVRLLP